MPEVRLLLIAGRSLKQGTGLNMGKDSPEYREAVGTVEMSSADMQRLAVMDGDVVQICSAHGDVDVRCRHADLPEGMAFIAYGPPTTAVVGTETQASGMPASKDLDVTVRPVAGGKSHAG